MHNLKETEWLTVNKILLELYDISDIEGFANKVLRVFRMLIPYCKGYFIIFDSDWQICREYSSYVEMGLSGREEKPTVIFVTHDIEEAVFLSSKVYVLTARPGTVKKEVPILLPYSRDLSLKDTEQFIRLRKEVNALFEHLQYH